MNGNLFGEESTFLNGILKLHGVG